MSRKLFVALALLAFSAGPGVAQQPPKQKPKEEPKEEAKREKIFPLGAQWIAISLDGKPLGTGTDRPTFILDQNLRGKGFGGCNSFSMTAYPLRQQKLAVGPVATTRKMCDKALMDIEKAYLLALRGAGEWDLEAGILVLKGQRGVLRFDRVL